MKDEMRESLEMFKVAIMEMAKMFNNSSNDMVDAFKSERLDARRMFRELTATTEQRLLELGASSEQRLDRANHMVDNLSKLEQVIAHEYTEHIQKLSHDLDATKQIVSDQLAYIRVLQDKVDQRDAHIKDLLSQLAELNRTVSLLAEKALNAQPLMYNNMAPNR